MNDICKTENRTWYTESRGVCHGCGSHCQYIGTPHNEFNGLTHECCICHDYYNGDMCYACKERLSRQR
ncbi:MAG: hypothetical protein JSW11_18080 [Candidatus Heimdallarchaeota archaeon]|nr:MAG: hypothetical protein JSW11_18080 [Candidatus Heimdallarchaeota archaeon]